MAQPAPRPLPTPAASESLSVRRRWIAFSSLMLGLFTILSAATSVGTAIPDIQKSLHATLTQVEWLFDSYLLSVTVFMTTAGRLGDVFGRRRMFLIGGVVFVAGSVASALASDTNVLIAARAITGLGPAMMMPATLSLVTDLFPPSERGLPMGLWGSMAGVAIGLGPVIGGMLVTSVSWEWVFWANALLGLISMGLVASLLPNWHLTHGRPRLDIPGVVLSGGFAFSLSYSLIEGNGQGWSSPLILGLIVASVVFLGLFILRERMTATPLVNLALFRAPAYSAGILVTLTISFGLLAVFSFTPLFLQGPLGYSALKSGLTLLPLAVAMALAGPFGGFLANRVTPRWPIGGALLLFTVGMLWLAHLTLATSWQWLAIPFLVIGVGLGVSSANINTAVMHAVPRQEAGSAAGVVATVRQLGSVLGVAVLGAVLQSRHTTHLNDLLRAHGVGHGPPAAVAHIAQTLSNIAFADALNDAYVVCAGVLALGGVVALFIRHSAAREL